MNRRSLLGLLALLGLSVSAFGQFLRPMQPSVHWSPGAPAVDHETLRRLAQQLGDPPASDDLQKWLKNNPIDPKKFSEIEKWLKANPDQAKQLLKQSGFQPEQLPEIQKKLQLQQRPPQPVSPPAIGPTPPTPEIPPKAIEPKQSTPPNMDPPQKTPPGEQLPTEPLEEKLPFQQGEEDYTNFVKSFENVFGPIDKVPGLKEVVWDIFMKSEGGVGKGSKGSGKSFWDKNKGSASNQPSNFTKVGNWFKKTFSGSSWNWGSGGGNSSGWNSPNVGSSGFNGGSGFSAGSFSIMGLGTAGTVLFFVVVLAVVAFLIWKFAPVLAKRNGRPQPLPGLGPWPIDPRGIRDREGIVLAFEYVSQVECGEAALVWNHVTIGEALQIQLPETTTFANKLAWLYALARYSPTNEPLSDAEIAQARKYLCELAGVPAP